MELFKIFGTIGLKNKEALDAMDETTNKAQTTSGKIGTAFSKVGGAILKGVGVAAAAATAGIVALGKSSISAYADYEQLAGGMEKIFSGMDTKSIAEDAANAYKDLGMSANDYLATINDVGAGFAATMGAEAGYEAAKKGLTAISDYASGTGKNLDELSSKFTLITRSTSSYQSIADQFSGILPATSDGFLEQAQAAGYLSDKYKALTEVPIDEYQQAVTNMLEKGVEGLNLTKNTANEATTTISGSLTMTKAAWSNFVTGLADENADLDQLMGNLIDSVVAVGHNIIPRIQTLLPRIATGLTTLASSVAQQLPGIMQTVVPSLLTAAAGLVVSLVQGITITLPTLIPVAVEAVLTITTGLLSMLPEITQAAFDIITELGSGLMSAFPQLLSTVVSTLVTLLPQLISGCVSLIVSLCAALPTIIQPIIEALPTIIISVVNALMENLPALIDGAVQLVVGLVAALPTIILALLNALPDIIVSVTNGLIGALPTLIAGVGSIITAVLAAVWAFLSGFPETVSNFVTTIWANISTVMTGLWETIKTTISTTINTIWTNISTVFTGIVTTVTTLISSVLTTVTSVFDSIKTTITDKIEAAKTAVSTAIEAIKGFFNFEWSLPSIKLPHFSISGSFSLNPPSIPTFGVDWYAKGGVLEEPTIFGVNGNSFMGGGEAGKEAVAPINVLQGYVADAVASQTSGIAEALERMAATLDAILGAVRDVDMDGMTIDLNRREFGRLVRAVT